MHDSGQELPIALLSKSLSNRTLPDYRPTVQQQTEMFQAWQAATESSDLPFDQCRSYLKQTKILENQKNTDLADIPATKIPREQLK